MVCGGVAALSALPSFAKSCVGALPPTPYTGEGSVLHACACAGRVAIHVASAAATAAPTRPPGRDESMRDLSFLLRDARGTATIEASVMADETGHRCATRRYGPLLGPPINPLYRTMD